jgi:hypothetical protein
LTSLLQETKQTISLIPNAAGNFRIHEKSDPSIEVPIGAHSGAAAASPGRNRIANFIPLERSE